MIKKFLFILIIPLFLFNLKAENVLSGIPKVIDGDTIKINDISVRLHGIDTPERNQKCKDKNNFFYFCGRVATKALISIIDQTVINCDEKDKDKYGRVVAVCFRAGEDINAIMVKEGMGIAYRYYSKDYVEEEEYAKNNKLGIWSGEFIEPYQWRKGKRF